MAIVYYGVLTDCLYSEGMQGTGKGIEDQPEIVLANMRKHLKSDLWEPINLGKHENYHTAAICDRWKKERNAWVGVSNDTSVESKFNKLLECVQPKKSAGGDVRGQLTPSNIPDELTNVERRQIRRTFKSLQGPYKQFNHYYPLEEAVDLYMEIWYEPSSSDY